jgi:preprotein translocase subunit YajC
LLYLYLHRLQKKRNREKHKKMKEGMQKGKNMVKNEGENRKYEKYIN